MLIQYWTCYCYYWDNYYINMLWSQHRCMFRFELGHLSENHRSLLSSIHFDSKGLVSRIVLRCCVSTDRQICRLETSPRSRARFKRKGHRAQDAVWSCWNFARFLFWCDFVQGCCLLFFHEFIYWRSESDGEMPTSLKARFPGFRFVHLNL